MPQLDPSSFSSQLFWLTIFFVGLYIMLARFLLPRVQSVIELRAHTISSDVDQAEALKSQAEQVKDVYESSLADVRAKSKAMIAETAARAAEAASGRQAAMDAELEKKLAESEAGIEKAKQVVMGKLIPVASELVEKIVNMLINQKLGTGDIDAVIYKYNKDKVA